MINPKDYNPLVPLTGTWTFTYKVDGIRMLRDSKGLPVSRAGKPLHNLEAIPEVITDAEIYLGSWGESKSAVSTHNGSLVDRSCAYSLNPLDSRLHMTRVDDPSHELIQKVLEKAVSDGFEGLVLYQGEVAYKVKPVVTYDLTILDIIEGKGKRVGCVGKMVTNKGNVGIFKGFTESDLRYMFNNRESLIGTVGEFACMQLTDKGKMRHGKLLKLRFDKTL